MGRRSFGISATQINRMISAENAAAKSRERQKLIESQKGICTEEAPTYAIINFDFNPTTRVCRIEIKESKKYRKIERYVTQNGIRHPIYGCWNTKSKSINKTIKLTNENLENLKHNSDWLVAKFSYDIISRLENENLYPSWFIAETLNNERNYELKNLKDDIDSKIMVQNGLILDCKNKITKYENNIKTNSQEKSVYGIKLENKKNLLLKLSKRNHIIILSIISFGIYALLRSKKRIEKLQKEIQHLESLIDTLIKDISEKEREINKANASITECRKIIDAYKNDFSIGSGKINSKYDCEISLVEPLPISLESSDDKSFIPLKRLAGMNYEKIVGCYIIRNTENMKCYVGQSKDVMKRVTKQHFEGTNVKNIIFAEDYYTSRLPDKADLFEVKIIKCSTKDELDCMEMSLIEEYDSFNNGYNSTSGNK